MIDWDEDAVSQPNTLLHFRLKQGTQGTFGLGLVSLESVKTKKVRFNILIVFVQIETLKPLSTQT